MKKQPAIINYYFKDAYIDLRDTIKDTFYNLGVRIRSNATRISDAWSEFIDACGEVIDGEFASFFVAVGKIFLFGFFVGQLVINAVFTTILCVLFTIFHVLVVAIIMILVYLSFVVMLAIDKIFCFFARIGRQCPRPGCQERISLPVYVCKCGAKHTSLLPSRYGIIQRTCTCGRKLPTSILFGRGHFVKKVGGYIECPYCGYRLIDPAPSTDISIPITGGPGSGKTCFLTQAIREIEKNAKMYGLEFKYVENAALGDDYYDNKKRFERGQLPFKTDDLNLRYYQFYLSNKGAKIKNLISICDIAGEAFDATRDNVGQQIGLRNAEAFLITLDPLSIDAFRHELKSQGVDFSKYKPSTDYPLDDVLLTLIRNLENLHAISSSRKVKAHVAVVLTKCDLPALDKIFGANAIMNYQTKHNLDDIYETYNGMCKEFLIKYGEANFINSLKSKFLSVQFFVSSALGHVENGTQFKPSGVEEPILWLVDKNSLSINLKQVWGKRI